jgi:hypothetical protein
MAAEDQELEKLYPGIEKQTRFALASTLTEVLQKSQENSTQAIYDTFTVRGSWAEPSNRYGVHIETVDKDKLEGSLGTAADWLVRHETGQDRTGVVAIPTINIRPNVTDKISHGIRPRNLTGAFKLTNKVTGATALYKRVRGKLVAMYRLVHGARIQKRSTIIEPTVETFKKELPGTFDKKLTEAFKTSK